MKAFSWGISACLFCLSSSASAALVELDLYTAGDALITRDTNTGLEWLDLPVSANRSFADVTSQFGVGGDFAGFRHATKSEIESFWSAASIPDLSASWTFDNFSPIRMFQEYIDVTQAPNNGSDGLFVSMGYALEPAPLIQPIDDYNGVTMRNFTPTLMVDTEFYDGWASLEVTNRSDIPTPIGHWLVRPVPLPPALYLFGAGLLGLVGMTRRKAAIERR